MTIEDEETKIDRTSKNFISLNRLIKRVKFIGVVFSMLDSVLLTQNFLLLSFMQKSSKQNSIRLSTKISYLFFVELQNKEYE